MRRIFLLIHRLCGGVSERLLIFFIGVVTACITWQIFTVSVKYGYRLFISQIGREFYVDDEWLGSWHGANKILYVPERYWASADVPIVQHTDQLGRRVTVQPPEDDYQSFALFAPDSLLFGINVSDDQTVSSRFAEIIAGEKIKAYNYGKASWGPGNMLALMTDPRFPSGIPEKRGFVIYSFNDLHILRAACWPFLFKLLPSLQLPKYVLDANDTVRRVGIVNSNDVLGATASKSSDDQYVQFDMYDDGIKWLMDHKEELRLTARLIAEANTEFQKRFDSQGFFVIFLPQSRYVDEMKALLEPMGIHCLDYIGLLTGVHSNLRCGNGPCLQSDGMHPTANGNLTIAEKLVQDLTRFGVLP